MAVTRMAITLKNALLSALLTNGVNASTLLGIIDIYTGSPPATPETAASGTLLGSSATLTAANMAQASAGVCVLSNPLPVTPSVTNTAGWARWKNAGAGAAVDVDLTAASGGGGMILSTLSLINGVGMAINNASIQMPETLGTIKLNMALRNKLVNILTQGAANIGLGFNGSILVYSGAAPASADLPATGTLLATFPTGTAGWAAPSAGSAGLSASLIVAASATGTAGYVRMVNGVYTLQGAVGTAGSDFILDSLSLVASSNTTLSNATFSF